ncbi:MAG: hypothetical protein M4579_007610 [Chaenotheca gracillima]|nr:MAG: hypothetical protein M4579_007610 [Chaenotheca gracillima]
MQSPAKTTLLYTRPVDKTNRLYPFCKQLREIFVSSGLITPEDRPLLLHVTVLNTIYAGGRGGKGKGKRWTFDARDLIPGVELEKIAICKMGATRVVDEQGQLTEEEEYEVVAERTILGGDG